MEIAIIKYPEIKFRENQYHVFPIFVLIVNNVVNLAEFWISTRFCLPEFLFYLINESLILNKAKDTVKKFWYVFQIKKKAVLTLIAVADTLTKR